MESAALGGELSCPICLNFYMEPVSLRCGHNFCRDCIVTALNTQGWSRVYSCPECRVEYAERPTLEKNRKLCNIVDNFRSTQQKVEGEILCTYCVDFPAAAVKTCLHCETSMCDKHLTAHNKTVDHELMEPTSFFSSKGSSHKKPLKYICSKDPACLCATCCLLGKHRGHEMELLEEALAKDEKLRNVLEKLTTTQETTEQKILTLEDQARKAKADDEQKRVTALFEDIRRQLEVQEQRVMNALSRHVEEVSLPVTDLIKQLEMQNDELSRKIGYIQQLCFMTDPITALQDQELDPDDVLRDLESETSDQSVEESSVRDLDDFMISLVLHRSITDLITNVQCKSIFYAQATNDILLDEKTAHTLVALSNDLRTASDTKTHILRPKLPQRFTKYGQVMSMGSFSHGRHYWEVDVGDCGAWDVGVCYPSIMRAGQESGIGNNNKSWSFGIRENKYSCEHDSQVKKLNLASPVQKLGVYLDYEGGRLSFYQLSDPIRHLHTFTTTFTEPLHAAIYLDDRAWTRLSPVISMKP